MKIAEERYKALVVDDEEGVLAFAKTALERDQYVVTAVASGDEALDILKDREFDVAIIDLKLGGTVDGQRVLEAIRWRWPATVVVMFTAHGTMETTLEAIREGVDGYLIKPVRPAELRKTVRDAFHRRRQIRESQQEGNEVRLITKGPFTVDLDRVLVERNGEEIELTSSEFKLLVHLITKTPQVVGPMELVEVVRDFTPDHMVEAREIIKWYIHKLRKKIEPDSANPRYILNVRGVGYRFAE